MNSIKKIQGTEFRRMQLIQLDMLAEFDRVCRINKINYSITCGTLLGAVRHQGYIPWDDDADIAMLREDYEKFKQVAQQMNPDICFFQDHETDPGYRWGYGKLRRTGTKFIRAGQEHLPGQTGVFIDIFPLDDIPKHLPGQILQDFYCFCLRKILWAEVGKVNEKSRLKRTWFTILSLIKPKTIFQLTKKMENQSQSTSSNLVRTLLFPSFGKLYLKDNPIHSRYGMPKKWFTELNDYNFEKLSLRGTKDYHSILTYIYKDYMTLPPENKREPHAPVSDYDFNNLYLNQKGE